MLRLGSGMKSEVLKTAWKVFVITELNSVTFQWARYIFHCKLSQIVTVLGLLLLLAMAAVITVLWSTLSQCQTRHMPKRVRSKAVTNSPARKASGVFTVLFFQLEADMQVWQNCSCNIIHILSKAKMARIHRSRPSSVSRHHLILWFWRRASNSLLPSFFLAWRESMWLTIQGLLQVVSTETDYFGTENFQKCSWFSIFLVTWRNFWKRLKDNVEPMPGQCCAASLLSECEGRQRRTPVSMFKEAKTR